MKFHVGQRVRLAWRRNKADLLKPARIVIPIGTRGVVARPSLFFGELVVNWDGGGEASVLPAQLERDDRPEAGSWDEISALTRGWRPGVVHVKA